MNDPQEGRLISDLDFYHAEVFHWRDHDIYGDDARHRVFIVRTELFSVQFLQCCYIAETFLNGKIFRGF